MSEAFRAVDVAWVRDGVRNVGTDRAATEEPLEIRLHGRPFGVIMRTPGADRELAAGFLLAERVLTTPDDLGTLEYCTDPSARHPENMVNATIANGSIETLERLLADRRQVMGNSSCGMCGRLTIESLRADAPADRDWMDGDGADADRHPRSTACRAARVRRDRRAPRGRFVHA